MKIQAVFVSLLFALVCAPAAFGQALDNPTNQEPGIQALAPGGYGVVPQSGRYWNKFPGFSGAYNNWVQYAPVQTNIYQRQEGSQNSKIMLPDADQYRNQVVPGDNPVRAEAAGFILPSGKYWWDGRQGVVPNPTMAMPGAFVPFSSPDSGYPGPQTAVLNTIDPSHNLRTTTITNFEFAAISTAQGQLLNEMRSEPQRWRQYMQAAQEAKQSSQSNSIAHNAEQVSLAAWETIMQPLINVANENAWIPCNSDDPYKSYANAAWMAGQMYKQVYIPMAILLLLPGAILTQTATNVRGVYLPDPTNMDEELRTPWNGIMRSIIAIFLIPATQLFTSYTIDVGNSLTWEVTHCPYWSLQTLYEWELQQTYDPKFRNEAYHIANVPEATTFNAQTGAASGMQGKARNTDEDTTVLEDQNFITSTQQQWFNILANILSQGMAALNAFQLVMIMYLFLLGPVTAALFAWPGIGPGCFRKVYSNWMDGVVLVTMWKFWWAVIMLAMMVRLDMQLYDLNYPVQDWNDQYEMYMFAAFVCILMYVPFNPFDFQPGQAIASVLDNVQSQLPKEGPQGFATNGVNSGGAGGGNNLAGSSTGPTGAGGKA